MEQPSPIVNSFPNAFRTEDGSFDVTAFKTCLKEDDIEAPKVDMERHGHQSLPYVRWLEAPASGGKAWFCDDRRKENHGTRNEEATRTQGDRDRAKGINLPISCLLVIGSQRSVAYFASV